MSWSTPDKTEYPLIDTLQNAVQHVRVDIYERNNYTTKLGSIEGLITGGNINVNGSSSVRRTGSLSLVAGNDDYFYEDISNLLNTNNKIATNKEVEIYIGIEDIDGEVGTSGAIYEFKLGRFVMKTASITHNTSGLNISLTLSDLMSKLNGELGGKFSTAITHHPEAYDTGEKDKDGNAIIGYRSPLVKDIIQTLVCEFGGIPRDQIQLDDALNTDIQNTVRWIGNKNVYIGASVFTIVPPANSTSYTTYSFNDNIGYQLTDFTFPGKTLESNVGETIVSVLDKIKNAIGDYEYYFDIDGIFHFEKVKTYLNQGSEEINLEKAIADKYLMMPSAEGSVYDFTDSPIITNYQSNPQWLNLKNDITVWGQRGDKTPIWYHLIINKKYHTNSASWTIMFKDKIPYFDSEAPEDSQAITLSGQVQDWRSQLILDYIKDKNNKSTKVIGSDWEPYAKELMAQWPRIFDIEQNEYIIAQNTSSQNWLNNLTYFFDALDPDDVAQKGSVDAANALRKITVETIGARQKTISNTQLNIMFPALYEDIIYVVAGYDTETKAQRKKALQHIQGTNIKMIQVAKNIGDCIAIGSAVFSLYDCVRANLHELTSYNETISVSMIPIFHLEPNTRVTFHDDDTHIDGDYIINSFSIPLAASGTMTLNCSKAIERI